MIRVDKDGKEALKDFIIIVSISLFIFLYSIFRPYYYQKVAGMQKPENNLSKASLAHDIEEGYTVTIDGIGLDTTEIKDFDAFYTTHKIINKDDEKRIISFKKTD